jgi:hypothetical protein
MQTHDLPSHAQPLPRLLVTLDTAVIAFGADHQHEIGGASRYAPAIVKWWSRWPKSPRRKTREVSRLTPAGLREYLLVSSRVRAGYELALQEQDFGLA